MLVNLLAVSRAKQPISPTPTIHTYVHTLLLEYLHVCLSQPAKGCLLVHVGAGRKAQGEDTLGLGEKGEVAEQNCLASGLNGVHSQCFSVLRSIAEANDCS